MLRALLVASYFAVAVAGCDKLFPELTGALNDFSSPSDGGTDGGSGNLTGTVCVLSDLRSPSTCIASGGRHITIEETRAAADANLDGSFAISLVGINDVATIAVVDGTTVGQSVPTIVQLSGAVLASARANGVALPVVREETFEQVAFSAGAPSSVTRGAILAWVLDGSGKAVAGASATRITGSTGPLYDDGGAAGLGDGVMTGPFGTVAFLDLPPGPAKLAIAAPTTSSLAADTFTLPVRGGAVTAAALQLPSR
jgi:hypothetical protein